MVLEGFGPFVDIGDFAGNGKLEAVVSVSGYRDGYALFYDDFAKSVQVIWNYH